MKIRVLGGGWYGCHIASRLLQRHYRVELHERADRLFAGASGVNPARLHLGFHYPRSFATRAACRNHNVEFMAEYGHLTRSIGTNIYAVAKDDSLVDFGNYVQTLRADGTEFVVMQRPADFGLQNIEGAVLTGERHIRIDKAREHFTAALGDAVKLGVEPDLFPARSFDWTIDCTFCAIDPAGVDRYEPCVVGFVEAPGAPSVTIMDGPFPSLYTFDEAQGLHSLTSASLTPLSKTCRSYEEARGVLMACGDRERLARAAEMRDQIARYWPGSRWFKLKSAAGAIRAMPKSGADSRLVEVRQPEERLLRIRAGKIDAIFQAEREVLSAIGG